MGKASRKKHDARRDRAIVQNMMEGGVGVRVDKAHRALSNELLQMELHSRARGLKPSEEKDRPEIAAHAEMLLRERGFDLEGCMVQVDYNPATMRGLYRVVPTAFAARQAMRGE